MDAWWEILSLSIDDWTLVLRVGPALWGLALLVFLLRMLRQRSVATRWKPQEVTFSVAGVATRLIPDDEVAQIAHQAWIELATRKAGIAIEDDDVIAEVYDSWYDLFGSLRRLARDVPVVDIENSTDAAKLLDTLVTILNSGLRPHLTKYQAKYRSWWERTSKLQPELSPQDRQRGYPEYDELMNSMRSVNSDLIGLTETLRSLAHERQVESLWVRLVRVVRPNYRR